MKTKSSNTPIHTVRLGHIQAAIWPTKTDKGTFYNTTITRTYLV
jgi:hypothetical protein